MSKVVVPARKDYKAITVLVNEADAVFFGIYTQSEAKEVRNSLNAILLRFHLIK